MGGRKLGFELLEFIEGEVWLSCACGNEVGVEFEVREVFAVGAVVAGEPVEEVIEFLDEVTSIFGGDGFGVVGCCVAYFVNDAEFGEKVVLEVVFKGLLVN